MMQLGCDGVFVGSGIVSPALDSAGLQEPLVADPDDTRL
jgi:pyridoxal biosynthesis lyase PdxS